MNNKINNPNKFSLSDQEKKDLKLSIFSSIEAHEKRKTRRRFVVGIAASLFLVIGISIFKVLFIPKSGLENFAEEASIASVRDSDNINIILADRRRISLDQKEANIKYSASGRAIVIENRPVVKQEIGEAASMVLNTVTVPYGKRLKLELSDESVIWLNSGSKLTFPIAFSENRREVYLEGEAIFEVMEKENHPFIVMAKNHEIEVLGTVFNVANYPDEPNINTVLKSGKVKVSYGKTSYLGNRENLLMTPGTMASFHKGNLKVKTDKVEVAQHFAWKNGVLILENNTFQYLAKRLERYYNVRIDITNKALAEEKFSGYLDLNNSIEEVIKIIQQTAKLRYDLNNKTIKIY